MSDPTAGSGSGHPHEPDELEPDPAVPPRPEEALADAVREQPVETTAADAGDEPVAGGADVGAPAQGEGRPDSH
jgi:hypothetical protein